MRKTSYERIMLQRRTDQLWLEADRKENTHPRQRFKMLLRLVRQGHNSLGLLGNLAVAYGDGTGVKRNLPQALRWYRKAWRRGDALSAYNAGVDHNLLGTRSGAILWFSRAVALQQVDAFVPLAKLLLQCGNRQAEAAALLRQRIAAGPQISFEMPVAGVEARPLPDEDLMEAQHLLAGLEGYA